MMARPNIRSPGGKDRIPDNQRPRYGGRRRKRHGCAVGRAALDHRSPRGVVAGRALAERDQVPGRRELVSRAILRDEPPHRSACRVAPGANIDLRLVPGGVERMR